MSFELIHHLASNANGHMVHNADGRLVRIGLSVVVRLVGGDLVTNPVGALPSLTLTSSRTHYFTAERRVAWFVERDYPMRPEWNFVLVWFSKTYWPSVPEEDNEVMLLIAPKGGVGSYVPRTPPTDVPPNPCYSFWQSGRLWPNIFGTFTPYSSVACASLPSSVVLEGYR